MRTNYKMVQEFKYFKPKEFGILTSEEVNEIKKNFEISERSDVELQNLRDFIVLIYAQMSHADSDKEFDRVQWDIMSAITGVIDHEKFSRGMEV